MNKQIQVELQDWLGDDRSVAHAAWTSSLDLQKKEIKTDEDVKRIVTMLIKDKHASPIETIVLRFWIKMPIATDRQDMTHRMKSTNGMSGRYRTMPAEWLNLPDDVSNILNKAFGEDIGFKYKNDYENFCKDANDWYQIRLKQLKDKQKQNVIDNTEYKRAREFLRGVLPQHNMTERVSTMNLKSFVNYMKLRNKLEAQPEIREVAQKMLEEVKKYNVCPIVLQELENNNWDI